MFIGLPQSYLLNRHHPCRSLNFYHIRRRKVGIIGIHYGSIGKSYSMLGSYSMLRVDVAEQVQPGADFYYFRKKLFIAIVDIIIKVEDAVSRGVGNQHICVRRDIGNITALTVSDTIAHKHRNAVEFHTVNLNTAVAKIMHVGVKTFNIGAIEAVVVVAADEYLMRIRQIAEPIQEVNGLLFGSDHSEVSGMHKHIGCRKLSKPPVAAVRIRQVQNLHINCKDNTFVVSVCDTLKNLYLVS